MSDKTADSLRKFAKAFQEKNEDVDTMFKELKPELDDIKFNEYRSKELAELSKSLEGTLEIVESHEHNNLGTYKYMLKKAIEDVAEMSKQRKSMRTKDRRHGEDPDQRLFTSDQYLVVQPSDATDSDDTTAGQHQLSSSHSNPKQ